MHYDILIVGAGVAGLGCAIKLQQLAQAQQKNLTIALIEKGADVGAHILSGAVIDPAALNELLADWQSILELPTLTAVVQDKLYFLTKKMALRLPIPGIMHNRGNYIVSLAQVCRELGKVAQGLGIDIFTATSAKELLFNEHNQVIGVKTHDTGMQQDGSKSAQYQEGVELTATYTVLAEGARGSLAQKIIAHYRLDKNSQAQSFGLGIKELWEVDNKDYKPGLVIHSLGWPLDSATYGGAFLYHMKDNLISYGFITSLDYQNPYLDPFAEMQRVKTHPKFKKYFHNAKRINYGARVIAAGGVQSLPKLSFPGGLLIGDAAGFVNVPRIKGSHNALKSGMLAAERIFKSLQQAQPAANLLDFNQDIKESNIYKELYQVRNIRPSFNYGLFTGLLYSAFDMFILRGMLPASFTLKHHPHFLRHRDKSSKINYPAYDQKLTFDKLSSVYLSNTAHREEQIPHVTLQKAALMLDYNREYFANPETRYCPAQVFEVIEGAQLAFKINASNCLHCKACTIKDPIGNILWEPPEGGDGPQYYNM